MSFDFFGDFCGCAHLCLAILGSKISGTKMRYKIH